MPTYQCQQCHRRLSSETQLLQCSYCGSLSLKVQRQKGASRSGPASQPFPPPLPDIPSLKGYCVHTSRV
ncbi:MAG: hypothetical protein ACKN9E_19215 [Microcystaceae cyanobacterium]